MTYKRLFVSLFLLASLSGFGANLYGFQMTDPVISLSPIPPVSANELCKGVIPAIPFTVTDVSGGKYTVTQSPEAGTLVDVGNTVVTVTVVNEFGNMATASINVSVIDDTKPVVLVKTHNLILDPVTGTGTLLASDIDNGSYDNCGIASLSVFPSTFECTHIGQQLVVLTVTDIHGNTETKPVTITVSSTVTISDIIVSTCIDGALAYPRFTVEVSGGTGPYTYSWGVIEPGMPFAELPSTFSATSYISNPLFNVTSLPIGTYTITLEVTDANGCSAYTEFILDHKGIPFDNTTILNSDACEGEIKSYSVSSHPLITSYVWSITGGNIISGQGTPDVTVEWGVGITGGVLTCDMTTSVCILSVKNIVTINPIQQAAFVSPATVVCEGSEHTYTLNVDPAYISYNWTVTGGVITLGGSPTDNFVRILWGDVSPGQIRVVVTSTSGCTSVATENITINPLPTATLTSSEPTNVFCEGTSVTFTAGGGANYIFRINGSPVQNSASATYTTSTLVNGDIVDVIVTDGSGCEAISAGITNTVNPVPTPTLTSSEPTNIFCEGISVTFTAGGGVIYTFRVNGSPVQSGPSATYTTTTLKNGDVVSVEVTNSFGCSATSTGITNTVNPLPGAAGIITGAITVCQGKMSEPYSVPLIMDATSYNWSYSGLGATITGTGDAITIDFSTTATSGILTVYGVNACGNGVSSSIAITIDPLPEAAGTITGAITVCQGQTSVSYTVPVITYATGYSWSYSGTGATITGTGNTITINFSTTATSGTLTVYGTNACGNGVSSSIAITVNPLPGAAGTITGTATVCQGQTSVSYMVPAISDATSYNWSYSGTGATITNNGNTITIDFSTTATSGNLTVSGVNDCGSGTVSADFPITVDPLPEAAGTITGTTPVCQGQTNVSYLVPDILYATSYVWSYSGTGATITGTGNTITIDFSTTATSGNLTVYGTNACGDGAVSANFPITVNPLPEAAGTITGTATVCQDKTGIIYSVPSILYATSYNWSYSGTGVTINGTGDAITIDFSVTATSGILTVSGVNDCGSGTVSADYFITVDPLPEAAGEIVGSDVVCRDQTGYSYSIPAILYATGYVWSYSGLGATISGTGDAITIDFSATATSGTLTVYGTNACGNGVSSSIEITVTFLPEAAGTIAGPSVVCQGQTEVSYTVPEILYATGYIWNYSGTGATIINNGNTITISFSTTATSGNLTVYGTNNCSDGAVSANFPITVNLLPGAAGAITGTSVLCQGLTGVSYSVPLISDATSYNWSYSGTGVTINGTGDAITIDFSITATSGILTVSGVNDCGSGIVSADFPITVDPLPEAAGAITGPAMVCLGQTGVVYTVPVISHALDYIWSLPAGATITAGAGTNSITVNFSDIAASGDITVHGENLCGTGAQSILGVTTNPVLPVSVSISENANSVCFGTSITFTATPVNGGLTPGYQWMVNDMPVSEAVSSTFTYVPLDGDKVTVVLTSSEMCTSGNPDTSNIITMTVYSLPEIVSITPVNVTCYNGSDGSISITATGGLPAYRYSIDGGITLQSTGEFTGLTPGNYSIRVFDANGCFAEDAVNITAPEALTIIADVTPAECPDSEDGSVLLEISGGSPQYKVYWSDGSELRDRRDLAPGTYSIIVTDANGCTTSITVTVGSLNTGDCIGINYIITPNGDGINDTWKIRNIDLFPDAEVFVYNRWGELVFRSRNILQDEWNGTSGGRQLPTDSYHYIIYLNDGVSKPRSGVISIIR